MSQEDDQDVFTMGSSGSTVLILIIVTLISFWAQALVTEERFVPALNVIATRFQIPDDVAGATLMAAGASSPELFTSFVSLFFTHSSLGLGTIVGSELFNQLVICYGAIMAARNEQLKLVPTIVLREVSFYGLSLVLLLIALSDRRLEENENNMNDEEPIEGETYIYISLFGGGILFGGYMLYVLVCSNYEQILSLGKRIKGQSPPDTATDEVDFDTLEDEQQPGKLSPRSGMQVDDLVELNLSSTSFPTDSVLRQANREPRMNFHSTGSHELPQTWSVDDSTKNGKNVNLKLTESSSSSMNSIMPKLGETLIDMSQSSDRRERSRLLCTICDDTNLPKPSKEHKMDDIERNSSRNSISCFLWVRSKFYSKARVGTHVWHLRWFTFTKDNVVSVPDRVEYQNHQVVHPKFTHVEVDEAHLLVRLLDPDAHDDSIIMAPNSKVLRAVVKACDNIAQAHRQVAVDILNDGNGFSCGDVFAFQDDASVDASVAMEDAHCLIAFPNGKSIFWVMIHFALFPVKALIHYTVPDVRTLPKATSELPMAFLAALSCIGWLIVSSYFMVDSLEGMGSILGIPDAVLGCTVSAAGTSLPNYVASQVAARQGFGNMAVSNAFGSNTFNILVGLGLPWTIYYAWGDREQYRIKDEGITTSVIIMVIALAAFIIICLFSGFLLHRWHAFLFVAMYLMYLCYAVGQVYL